MECGSLPSQVIVYLPDLSIAQGSQRTKSPRKPLLNPNWNHPRMSRRLRILANRSVRTHRLGDNSRCALPEPLKPTLIVCDS